MMPMLHCIAGTTNPLQDREGPQGHRKSTVDTNVMPCVVTGCPMCIAGTISQIVKWTEKATENQQ